MERPQSIFTQTPRYRTGCGWCYITISTDSDYPYEIMALLGKTGGCARANVEALTRTITVALQEARDPQRLGERITKQIRGILCPQCGAIDTSCPDAISRGLDELLNQQRLREGENEQLTTEGDDTC